MSARATADTIVAVATAPGRGGVGVLRLSGPQAFAIATQMAGPLPPPRQAALRRFRDEHGETLDEGLLLRFDAPASYTGEDVIELQGHGAPVVLERLTDAACACGARRARPGEFTERAFLNDRLDLAQAEAVADLIDAQTASAARAAQRSLQGEFSAQINALIAALTELRVYVEGALDFSDEDIDWLSQAQLHEPLQALRAKLAALLREAQQGARLNSGLTVALAGQPNVGKSTLLNALAGREAAIVTDIAGTTRDVLRQDIAVDGLPLTVVDTAGLRDTEDPVEKIGVARAWQALSEAELLLFVVDDRAGYTETDAALLAKLPAALPVLLLHNKCDLSGRRPERFEAAGQPALRLAAGAGAGAGAGLELLRAELLRLAGFAEHGENLCSARARHLDALRAAQRHVEDAAAQLAARRGAELVAEELRLAQQALGAITGAVSAEALLGEIFSRFCIGK